MLGRSYSGLLFLVDISQYLGTLNTMRAHLVLLTCLRTEAGHLHQPDLVLPSVLD